MNGIYMVRESILGVYYKNAKIMDKVFQFLLALACFVIINQNVGFMEAASSIVVSVALAVICAFLPLNMTVVVAALLLLVHMYAVSYGTLAMTAAILVIMYVFYLRLTPKMGLVILLTPIAFVLKVPYVVPVVCGLVTAPVSLVAISCGVIVYYMMAYVKTASSTLSNGGIKEMLAEVTQYAKQVFQNKEMWILILAFIICVFVVYALRRASFDHAWTIAIFVGVVVNAVVIVSGSIALETDTSMGSIVVGSVAAIVCGLVVEFFRLNVDYSRSEMLTYEDDDYYYYVKAVPKISVSREDKQVKKIHSAGKNEDDYLSNEEAVDKELLKRSMEKELNS